MERREVLTKSLMAAGAVAGAACVPTLTFATSFQPMTNWVETPCTQSLLNAQMPALNLVKTAQNVHALTPTEWKTLANQQLAWASAIRLSLEDKVGACEIIVSVLVAALLFQAGTLLGAPLWEIASSIRDAFK